MLIFKEVVSSNIKAIAWEELPAGQDFDLSKGLIHVVFNNNAHWVYGPFPRHEYDGLDRSASKGQYFQNIKNQVKVLHLEEKRLPDYEPQPHPGKPFPTAGNMVRCPVCRSTANTVEGVKHRVGCGGWALK